MSILTQVLVAWLTASAVMSALWAYQKKSGDAGIVDVVWTLGVGAISMFFAGLSEGLPARRAVIAGLVGIWALRLAIYVLRRLKKVREGRYDEALKGWGDSAQWKMFWFYQLQAFWAVLFSLPMLVAAANPRPWQIWDWLACGMWAVSITGEAIADWQLGRFRSNPENKGKVCRDGLWHYSRHPNYFFEWLHWWTYVLFAVGGPWWWTALFGPACMLLFLLKVTGVPPTEAQALRSRGDAYRAYQRTTSVFFPWPPKTDTRTASSPR